MIRKKKVMLTGGSGFIGKNIFPFLQSKYDIFAPTRGELDLRNENAVKEYIREGSFDTIIHGANPNPVKNEANDKKENMFEDSMRIFMNFYNNRKFYGKLLYFGSGAEYDKTRDIKHISENKIGENIPKDIYGFSKFCMNELARGSQNIYNLRIFGCYGPHDHESKFLTHVIKCCKEKKDITIRQNCVFDYMHVYDLAPIIIYMIENELRYHDYNVCTGTAITLEEIALKIKKEMRSDSKMIFLSAGLNKEYTADNSRLLEELGEDYSFIKIEDGIKKQINYELNKTAG